MNKLYVYLSALILVAFSAVSCNPEAKWVADDSVDINMSITTVSAGFIECDFSTNKDAYYLIAIEEAKENYKPMEHQKQFMMLALDSANTEYIQWRNTLLKQGEFNIAPFASHVLQYGDHHHFFTGLLPNQKYWVYAFVVNPASMQPVGKLHFQEITTTYESIMDIHFEYRVKGRWDYTYPIDTLGLIYAHFPYIATTRDSAELREDSLILLFETPQLYFQIWMIEQFLNKDEARVLYGVAAVENDGVGSHLAFEEGHTYYTAIGGYDGSFKHFTLYKFNWRGEQTEYYFVDSLSIANDSVW